MIKLNLAVLTFVALIAAATAGENKMTPLDKAYEVATKQPEKQSDYYSLFLNSEIFIPTHDVPVQEGHKRAGKNETIRPVIIESGGNQHLMLFDTKERLSAWAKREIGFAAVRGHVVVEMMGSDIRWVLNAGTSHEKVFVPDEIKWLKTSIRSREASLSKGTKVLIGAPAKIPEGLTESLSKNLSQNPEVKEAYLGQVHYVKEGEVPHLALVLRIDVPRDSMIDAIRKDVTIASRSFLGKNDYIDIFVDNGSGVASEVIQAVKPFYARKNTR